MLNMVGNSRHQIEKKVQHEKMHRKYKQKRKEGQVRSRWPRLTQASPDQDRLRQGENRG